MSDTRIPTQKRSIEKKHRIVEKGFELICKKGFYNTNTQEIAEYAGVSTGIIYQYFNDKKEIFIEGVKNYSDGIMYPMINLLELEEINYNNLENIIKNILDKFIETHTISKKAHEELMAMSHLDEDISNIFKESELKMTEKIVSIFENNNIILDNSTEKVHIIIGIIENLCHEIVYHNHEKINYNVMKNEIVNIIKNILNKNT